MCVLPRVQCGNFLHICIFNSSKAIIKTGHMRCSVTGSQPSPGTAPLPQPLPTLGASRLKEVQSLELVLCSSAYHCSSKVASIAMNLPGGL